MTACTAMGTLPGGSANSSTSSSSQSESSLPADCFTVTLPQGWSRQPSSNCSFDARSGGAVVHILRDTEPIDAETLRALIDEKYDNVRVIEKTVNSQRVLVGTGSVPGVIHVQVQALPATATEAGYYAQFITTDETQLADADEIFASIRPTF